MNDIAAILTAGAGAFGVIGGGIRFAWNKIESRFQSVEAELAMCRQRETDSIQRCAIQITVIELLWQEVHRFAPSSPVLKQGKKLLDELKVGASHDRRTTQGRI